MNVRLLILSLIGGAALRASATPINIDHTSLSNKTALFAESTFTWPNYDRDGKQAVLAAASKYVSSAESSYPYTRRTGPVNWLDQTVYHIVVDRFMDGDSARNGFNLPKGQQEDIQKNHYWNAPNFREGGDLKGVQDRLDYLVDLGVTTLWVTPIAKHTGEYHGYCTADPTQIDPGFGSNEDFRELVKEAHARGIYVIMDIVVNHLCDPSTRYSSNSPNRLDCSASLSEASWSGSPSEGRNRGLLSFSDQFFGPLKSQAFFARCGSNNGEDTTGTGPSAVFGDFAAGFFDYDTRNYDFQEVFTELHKYWVAFADVDGFRLDAAKHVTEDFIAHFATHMRAYANKLGKPDFYIIGEVAADVQWEGRRLGAMFHNLNNLNDHGTVPASLTYKLKQLEPIYKSHPSRKYPGLDAVYDFHLGGTMRNVILNYRQTPSGLPTRFDASPARIGDYFANEYKTVAFNGVDMRAAYVPLEIHDWPRLLRNELDSNPLGTAFLGAAFLTTMQGQPIIYYGFEQAFAGTCAFDKIVGGDSESYQHLRQVCQDDSYSGDAHSLSRQSMFVSSGWKMRSAIEATNKLAGIGPRGFPPAAGSYDWKKDPYLDTSNVMYKFLRKMLKVRKSCEALRRGSTFMRVSNDYGLLAYSRVASYEAVVLLNVKREGGYNVPSYTVNVDASLNADGGQFKNLLNPAEVAWVRNGAGGGKVLDFGNGGMNLGPRGFAIFVPANVVGGYDAEYQSNVCTR
ncbi:hypothetical protein HDV05_004837 [Chytridiales sp. JEL 0842]|nr:hypothetical protein HDV05_004837 [Chytridiales sp. JEL 0842]